MDRAWVYALVVDWGGGGGLIEEFCFGQGDEICGVIWFDFLENIFKILDFLGITVYMQNTAVYFGFNLIYPPYSLTSTPNSRQNELFGFYFVFLFLFFFFHTTISCAVIFYHSYRTSYSRHNNHKLLQQYCYI
jgi:hypothetical protein